MGSSRSLLVPDQRLEAVRFKVERAVPMRDVRSVGWYQRGHAKYGEPFWIAETEKLALRRARVALPGPYDRMVTEAREFWTEYEEVNRRLLPDDPVYSKATTALTTATTNDIWELGAAAATQLRIIESFVAGENTASTVARINVSRVTSQGTGTAPTAYTPEKYNTRSSAAASTVYGGVSAQVAWGTAQATLAANPLLVHGLNTFGGSDRWVAQPGEELYMVNAEFVSMRSATGTPIISAYVVFEEL
jgi:hypothetical protein